MCDEKQEARVCFVRVNMGVKIQAIYNLMSKQAMTKAGRTMTHKI